MFGGLVVVARAYPEFGRSGPQKLIALAGVYSYTIYLAHSVLYELPGMMTVRRMVFPYFGNTGDRVLFFGLSILLGVVISHLIERPFLRLRAKWLPSHYERSPIVHDIDRQRLCLKVLDRTWTRSASPAVAGGSKIEFDAGWWTHPLPRVMLTSSKHRCTGARQ